MTERCQGLIRSGKNKGQQCPVTTNLLTCENGEKSCRNCETQFQTKKNCRNPMAPKGRAKQALLLSIFLTII